MGCCTSWADHRNTYWVCDKLKGRSIKTIVLVMVIKWSRRCGMQNGGATNHPAASMTCGDSWTSWRCQIARMASTKLSASGTCSWIVTFLQILDPRLRKRYNQLVHEYYRLCYNHLRIAHKTTLILFEMKCRSRDNPTYCGCGQCYNCLSQDGSLACLVQLNSWLEKWNVTIHNVFYTIGTLNCFGSTTAAVPDVLCWQTSPSIPYCGCSHPCRYLVLVHNQNLISCIDLFNQDLTCCVFISTSLSTWCAVVWRLAISARSVILDRPWQMYTWHLSNTLRIGHPSYCLVPTSAGFESSGYFFDLDCSLVWTVETSALALECAWSLVYSACCMPRPADASIRTWTPLSAA